ncbi:hypothetical protein PoMZ_03336 [Pyricularia oryzae]|uniref:Major facilitator superfamily (MFS) profile domain-containing protein n=1 Tax=Pyricularia oryzae TaxID=318829 RepID=A0A4P7NCR5_PYROR|nr:hypothetical protein PoMZ_03336 [Pyricularia oryzae]
MLFNFINTILLGYDVSNVTNIQIPIVTDFGKIELLTWVAIGYIIVNFCVVPFCRRLYIFGNAKWHIYIYVCIWMAGATVAGIATNMDFVALIGIGFAIGLLFGPVVGGAFAKNHSTTWRWAIYINIPVLVFLVGSELCTAAWVFTGILGTVYVAQQTFCIFTTPENRIFPVKVLRERILILLMLSVAMAAAAYGISLYYTPLFFAFTQNAIPLEAGLDLIPFIGNFVGTTIVANILLSRFRLYAPLYILGNGIIIIGSALQNLITVDNPKSFILGKLAVVDAGLDLVFQTGGNVFKAVAAGDIVREGDYITAFVTFGCIFQNLGVKYVREAIEQYIYGILIPNDGIVRKILAGLGSELIGGQQLIVELRRKMAENITEIIRKLYFIIIIIGATILLYRCFIPWGKLNFISADKAKMDEI